MHGSGRSLRCIFKHVHANMAPGIAGNEEPADVNNSRPASLQRVTTRQSVQLKTKKWLAVLRRCFIDPLKIILLLRFPAVAITVYYASITFGSLYFLNISVETTFSGSPYNFSSTIVGLLY